VHPLRQPPLTPSTTLSKVHPLSRNVNGGPRRRTWNRWPAQVVANVTVGAVAVAAWPFVYFMGYGIADQFGWIVADPTVTDDGVSILIGAGVAAIVVVAGAFAALNGAVGRWTRIPTARWIPAGAAISLLVAVVGVGLWYR
jgi:Na+-transporting methylmalonyl-CoA/oxaloacetate decarboxylase beta subunit